MELKMRLNNQNIRKEGGLWWPLPKNAWIRGCCCKNDHLKWSISNNRWIRQKTDSTAVHSREKNASCLQQICQHYNFCIWMFKTCIMNDEFFQSNMHQSPGEMHCVFCPGQETVQQRNGALNYKPAMCGTFWPFYFASFNHLKCLF